MTLTAHNASALSGRLVGIIWGDTKVGKTTWACSLPGRKLLINFDPEGYSSIAQREDVDVIDLSNELPKDAMRMASQAATFIKENADKYSSVITDSITTLTETSLYAAIANGVGKSDKFAPSLDAPGLSAWGARNNGVNDIIGKIIRATGQTKLHCFFIAHADDPEFSKDGKSIVQQTIMVSAKIRQMAGLKVSEIYYMETSQGRRKVYLTSYGVKKPMGSRIFNTEKFKSFDLHYDPTKPDAGQNCSLHNIVQMWQETGFKKLEGLPKI